MTSTDVPREAASLADHLAGHRFASELRFADAIASRAGLILTSHYERLERIDLKTTKDVVTEVDHLSEELIIRAIRATYPDDAIMAEETGEHRAVAGEAPTSGRGRVWIIDPVDGTINYANGIPFFCVAIGLVVDSVPSVGIIHDPMRGETYGATVDGPAWLRNGRESGGIAIHASTKESIVDLVVSMGLSGQRVATRARGMRRAVRVSRNMGSAALALAYVANGRFDAMIQQGGLSPWDVAGAGLIAERAGATVTNMAGGPWFDFANGPKTIGVLAAPAGHHATILDLLK